MAFVSTIIGGGMVGLPYSFYHAGIPMGIILNFIFALLTIYSCLLLLEAKNLVGNLTYNLFKKIEINFVIDLLRRLDTFCWEGNPFSLLIPLFSLVLFNLWWFTSLSSEISVLHSLLNSLILKKMQFTILLDASIS